MPAEPARLLCGLAEQMQDSALCAEQDLGHMEEQLLPGGHEVFRQMLEKGAQLKAEQVADAWRTSRFQRPPWRGKRANKAGAPRRRADARLF